MILLLAQAVTIDYTGLASVITAFLTPISVIVLAYFAARKINKVEEKVDANTVITQAIDDAVNGKAPGEATISEEVTAIHAEQVGTAKPAEGNGEARAIALLPMVKDLVLQVAALRASLPDGKEWEPTPPKKKPSTRR